MTERRLNVTEPPPPRPTLQEGTFAHYDDSRYYDRAYRRYRADIDFYLQCALAQTGPVLELGCGTGRVTLPLARAGVEVVGIDVSTEMLQCAQEKLADESSETRQRVSFRHGNLEDLELHRQFSLIISPFNVLQHLYTLDAIERCLTMVRRHLAPEGRFVFDVLLPDTRSLSRNPGRRYKLGRVYHPAGEKRYFYQESFDYNPLTQVQYITMYFVDPDDEKLSFETPLCHRQFFPEELKALLHYNRFEVAERYGSFDRSELAEDSESQIYLCELAQGTQRG